MIIASSDALRFRRMTEADLDYVMAIERAAARERFVWEWSRERHEQSLEAPGRLHVIIESVPDGLPVGFIFMNEINSASKCVEFQRIVVQPTDQGYGSQAIRLLKRHAFEDLKAHRVWLSVKDFNARARAVYRAEGFVEEGTLRECVKGPDRYESVLIMAILDREYDHRAMELDPLRYPIGKWQRPANDIPYDQARIWIDEIAVAPAELREAVEGLSDKQLDTPYREGGWTVRQVVHHLPDSHINAYVRFKHAATAARAMPVAQPYDEAVWAELDDAKSAPIDVSLSLLDALHSRWVRTLRSLDQAGLDRRLLHPEIGELSIGAYLSGYAWHGRHHVTHITALRQRMGW